MEKAIKVILLILLVLTMQACKNDNKKTDDDTSKDSLLASMETIQVIERSPDQDIIDSSPKFSIVIDDFGNYNEKVKDSLLIQFCQLPEEVTFAVLPNLAYTERVMDLAIDYSHDVIIHVPMEPTNKSVNPGKEYISPSDDEITIINKLNDFHKQVSKAVGINNHMGSLATADIKTMETVLNWCHANDLFFIDSATSTQTVAYSLAKQMSVPTAKRSIFLDVPNPTVTNVDKYIERMKKYYKYEKDILIITHCTSKERLDNLKYFIEEVNKIGYNMVKASQMLELQEKPI